MSMTLMALAATAGALTVNVGNVRSNRGTVVVAICTQDKFLEDHCAFSAEAPARAGVTTVVISNVPAGTYAAQAFHDENSNNDIDRAMFGIPKEGVGFSRNAPIRMSPPKWAEAQFRFGGEPGSMRFDLRYFMGASGPRTMSK